jgi:SAM-dependent methyltransferase
MRTGGAPVDPRFHETLREFWSSRAERERRREEDDPAKRVHTDLLRREVEAAVGETPGRRILDAGAGTGRFSLPLARGGHRVVHLDVSPTMIESARRAAGDLGDGAIEFVEGTIDDLSRFPDGSFDVTLCLDSPLSFCHDRHEAALDELTRVTSDVLVLCVMNRTGVVLEDGGFFDLTHFERLRTLPDVYETGSLEVGGELLRLQPTLVPSWHAYRPEELLELLERRRWTVRSLWAPGTLARFTDRELLTALLGRPDDYASYLAFADRFDRDPAVLGVGAARAGGLAATATRRHGDPSS